MEEQGINSQDSTPKRKWAKRLWRLFKWVSITLISLVALLIILAYVFEDKIKRYALDKINQHLTTEIQVKEINFTFIRHFPYASLEFKEVYIQDPPGLNKSIDTFLYAKTIYLNFSIWDVLSGDYKVNSVGVNQAKVNLFIDNKGNENYKIWKTDTTTSDSKFEFNLQQVFISHSRLTYVNEISHQNYAFVIDESKLKGNFNEREFTLNSRIKGELIHFISGNLNLVKKKYFALESNLNINQDENNVAINSAELKLGNLRFTISGDVTEKESGSFCDLKVRGKDIEIESVLKTFPNLFQDKLDNYESKGRLEFVASVSGIASKSESPLIVAEFGIKEGNLFEKTSKISLKNLQFDGYFISRNETNKPQLVLEAISGTFEDGNFKGRLALVDFVEPFIYADLNADLNLKTLQQFLQIAAIESADGNLQVNAKVQFNLNRDAKTEDWNYEIAKAEGKASIANTSIKMLDHPIPFKDFTGVFVLKKDNALIENLKGAIGKTQVSFHGILHNMLPFILFEGQKLNIVADFSSPLLDLDDLLSSYNSTESVDTTSTKLIFPANINFNLDASIGEIKYSTFNAKSTRGNFKLIDKIFTGNSIEMALADGKCSGRFSINGQFEEQLEIKTRLAVEQISISKLFVLFKDFGQSVITNENCKGKLTANVEFAGMMNSYLRIDQNKIISIADLTIENGEIIKLQAFADIISYMKSDKKLKLFIGERNINDLQKRLEHIKFEKLYNSLEIKDGKVIIPEMHIQNSVMDINLFGSHSFDNTIDYHFNFRFLDLKADKSETEYGTIVDDGTGLKVYIRMTGNSNNPSFSWDGKARKADRKEYNKNEIKTTKAILQKEFGLFKKDSTLKITPTPEEEVKFLFDWDNKGTTNQNKQKEEKEDLKEKRRLERMEKLKKKLGLEEKSSEVILESDN